MIHKYLQLFFLMFVVNSAIAMDGEFTGPDAEQLRRVVDMAYEMRVKESCTGWSERQLQRITQKALEMDRSDRARADDGVVDEDPRRLQKIVGRAFVMDGRDPEETDDTHASKVPPQLKNIVSCAFAADRDPGEWGEGTVGKYDRFRACQKFLRESRLKGCHACTNCEIKRCKEEMEK